VGLERSGFKVDTYSDPQKALCEFRPGNYDLLLLDVRMPGMTGLVLYKEEIRQIDENAKVCLLTAAFETCRKEFAVLFTMLNEVKCFLKKPIAMDDIVKRLGALLEPN
jgi:DNA-binding response OmpR family regulator